MIARIHASIFPKQINFFLTQLKDRQPILISMFQMYVDKSQSAVEMPVREQQRFSLNYDSVAHYDEEPSQQPW